MPWQQAGLVLIDELLLTNRFWSKSLSNHGFSFSQVLDGMLAQYGAVESCEQGKYTLVFMLCLLT